VFVASKQFLLQLQAELKPQANETQIHLQLQKGLQGEIAAQGLMQHPRQKAVRHFETPQPRLTLARRNAWSEWARTEIGSQ
jgi:hypothetical protein